MSREFVRKIWIDNDSITLICTPWRFRPIVQYQAERYILKKGEFPALLDFQGMDRTKFLKLKWKSRLLIKQYDPKDKKYREVEIVENFFDNWEELLVEMGLEIIEVGNKKVVQHRK